MLMITAEDEAIGTMMLHPLDFPNYYTNFIHPTDYVNVTEPFIEHIFHQKKCHNRLLLRICTKIDTHTYLPLTFVIDTGAPAYIFLCPRAKIALESIIKLDDVQNEFLLINGKKLPINETPSNHDNINVIGVMALSKFGFHFEGDEFAFNNLPHYFNE